MTERIMWGSRLTTLCTLLLNALLLFLASTEPGNAQEADPKRAALIESFEAGMKALNAQQYEAAIASLSRASTLGPTQTAVWANLSEALMGLAKTRSGREQRVLFERADEASRMAIALSPTDAGILNNHAMVLAKLGRLSEAKSELEKTATLDVQNSSRYYFNLGAILYNGEQDDAAVEALQKVPAGSAHAKDAASLVARIRSENPFDKSLSYLQTAAFRQVIGKYLAAAKTRFVELRGESQYSSPEMKVWDSPLRLPGAKTCGIVDNKDQAQMSCSMSTARNAALLASEFKGLVAALASVLPAGLTSTQLPPENGLAGGYRFLGPGVEVWVTESYDNKLVRLSVAVMSYAKLGSSQ